MKIKLIDLKRQHDPIKKEMYEELDKIIEGSSFIMGENVKSFEKEFSEFLGIKNSISVGNGTDALVIALRALGIKKDDEVITTTYTFFASAESIAMVGAKPVFIDVDINTFNMDVNKIEEKITSKTKAIMAVHIFGQACDMGRINFIAKKHNLFVIEDACQAIGAKHDGKMVGTMSDIACFSFFPTKNLGCMGDGGMIVTNNDDLATICRAFRAHGSGKDGNAAYNLLNENKEVLQETKSTDNTVYNPLKYYNYLIAYNSRLDEMQAIILRLKLKRLNEYTNSRQELAAYYDKKLAKTVLETPKTLDESTHVYHLYILKSDNRDYIIEELGKKEIATGIYYQLPLHLQKAFEYLGYKKGDFPNSEKLSKTTFAIPMFSGMNDEEKEYISNNIMEILRNGK